MAGAYDSECDLQCKGKGITLAGPRHEFVGPVKIVLMDSSPADYQRKVWGSAVFTFVMLLLGTTVFTVFFFTLKFQLPFNINVHVLLCTMGFQLFMTTGIMMFSSLFGGSMHLKSSERKFQHFFLEASGVLLGVVGTLFVLRNMAFTLHALTGFLAAVLSILTSVVGPTVYVTDTEKLFGLYNKKAHRRLGIPTFVLGSICFALALIKDSFLNWMPIKHLHRLLAALLAVTAFALGPSAYATSSANCFGRFTRNMHKFFAVPAFMFCNLCFALGLIKPSFKSWSPFNGLPYFLIILCLLYNAGAMLSVYLRSKYHV